MNSMYETIMELPLFKGIGVDQVSLMLEKTSFDFLNFDKDDILIRPSDKMAYIDFILKGEVAISHCIDKIGICVKEIAGVGRALGAIRLFGLNTQFSCEAKAISQVSVLRISKEQYFNLLLTDRIYILNLLNYLSAASQKPLDFISSIKDNSIFSRLSTLVSIFSSAKSSQMELLASDSALADFCGVELREFSEWKKNVANAGIIRITDNGLIFNC